MEEKEVLNDEVQEQEANVDVAEESSNVPPELEGLSDEVIKETLAEVEGDKAEENAEEVESGTDAELNSDNKESTEQTFEKPKQKIPYERFKTEVDKNKSLKAELDELKAKYEKLNASTSNIQQQSENYNQQSQVAEQKPQPKPQFNKEQIQAIHQAIRQEALTMSGLSEEDVNSLEYMDDDDDRKMRWKFANDMATQKISNAISQAQYEQQARMQKILEYHNKITANYNDFVKKEMSDPNHEQIKAHATGAFFESLSDDMQPIIADAYTRISHGTASPQDIALIQRFYIDAKNDFNSKGGINTTNTSRVKQTVKQPRSGQVEGSAAGAIGTPSVATLERMLNEKPWDEIPDEYKAILKGL